MNAPQQTSPRRRLQELLAIPDNQRTDAEWDELNELEISLAPGNREGAPDPNLRRPTPSTGLGRKPPRPPRPGGQQKSGGQGKPPAQARPAGQPKPPAAVKNGEEGQQQQKKPARKFRKRSPKPNPTPGPQTE
jgi:hypothetical protein